MDKVVHECFCNMRYIMVHEIHHVSAGNLVKMVPSPEPGYMMSVVHGWNTTRGECLGIVSSKITNYIAASNWI